MEYINSLKSFIYNFSLKYLGQFESDVPESPIFRLIQ